MRNQPVTLSWFDLAEHKTQTLLLPFSEGMRVPTTSQHWGQFLAQEYSGSNTTQDLKMPFWSAQQGDRFVNYQLVTPTNNELGFDFASQKIDMRADHQFTSLNQSQTFKVKITLGKDSLSGARSYRQWRVEHGQSQSLEQKQKLNPEVAKMVGASQVYLFGTGVISTMDVADWWGLNTWYTKESGSSFQPKRLRSLNP